MKVLTLFGLILLCVLAFSATANAQGFGKIVGTVTDANGAAIANAKITANEVGKGWSRTADADSSGYYVLDSLRPAQYDMTVELTGFRTFYQKALTLLADQTLTLNVTMQVGTVTESVSVVSGNEQVDTTTGTLKQVIEQQRITELPLNGRNAATLTLTVAGAVQAPSGGADQGSTKTFPGAVTISANGSRQNQISYQLDGGNNVDEYTNVNQPFPMPDALQEFSVQTSNYSAQYGQNAGAVVNVVTRSGGDQFHGNAFDFVRNRVFNARNWAAAAKDQIKRNQFGGTFGGPIIRDKTFFFAGYQQTIFRNIAGGVTATVPNAALRATATDPAIINLLKGIPVGDANNKVSYSGRPDIQDFKELMIRGDHSFSQKDQLTFRYFFDHFTRNAVFDETNYLRYSDGSTIKSQNFLGHWTHVIRPTLINDFRVSYAPENATRGPADNAKSVQDLGVDLPFEAPKKSIQQIRVNGFFSFGDNPQASFIRNNISFGDDVSWVKGKHDLKFGLVLERSKVDLNNQFFQPAEFSFSSIANFLAGKLSDYSGNLAFRQGAGEFKENRNTFFGIYLQDNYRFSRKLTLNLGLRWEPAKPWRELKNRVEQFRLNDLSAGVHSTQYPNAPAGVFYPGDTGVPQDGIRPNYTNFAPRVGFAYDLKGDGRTSIRGGFGIFYDTRIPGIINNRFVDLSPFSPQLILNTGVVNPGTFSDPLCQKAATQALQNCTNQKTTYPFPFTYPPDKNFDFGLGTFVLSWDPVNKYQTPTVNNWNLSVERQLKSNLLLRAAYVGSHSSHLTETLNLNPRPVGGTSTTPFRLNAIAATVTKPFPGCTAANCPLFSTVQQDLQDINANYKSFQIGVERRSTHGLTILANYTWSRSTDDLPPGAGVTGFDTSSARPWDDPLRHQLDWGPSEFDHTHRFVGSYVWLLPGLKGRNSIVRYVLGDWQISGLVQAQSGRPLTILSGVDRSGTAIGLDRAKVVGPAYGAGTCAGLTKACKDWLSLTGFATNDAGTFGDAGKGAFRFPGLYLWDLGLTKNFKITEKVTFQLRGEFFNVFNHVNFDESTAAGNFAKLSTGKGNFGALTTALDPRIGQIGMKLIF
jgi:Carboxypeptidase regulatory-like domain